MHEEEFGPPSSRDVEDTLRPARKLLAKLTRSATIGSGDVVSALRQLTEVGAQLFRVDRASVWRLDREGRRLTLADLYERRQKTHTSGTVLGAELAPAYFRALEEERSIAAHDACRDPRTREFRAGYLDPLRIGAMLDAPVFVQGEMAGVVCMEHVGNARQWQPWEEIVAGNLADFVALALEAEGRAQAEAEVKRYQEHLESLVAERTRALEEVNQMLRRSEEAFEKLFAVSPVALVLTGTKDQKVRLANARAKELFGVDDAEGLFAPDFYENASDRAALIAHLRGTGRVETQEVRLRPRGKEVFWGALSAELLKIEDQELTLIGVHDLTPQKQVEGQLRDLATRDGLTGLFNRRHFFELASHELSRQERYDHGLGLAMIDVDHFKRFNDVHGHLVGDDVLRWVAATLGGAVRGVDVLARYGGEEFALLLPETDASEGARVVERLRVEVAREAFASAAGPLAVTVSAGVVAWRSGEALETLLGRADEALYAAKAGGRDRVVVA